MAYPSSFEPCSRLEAVRRLPGAAPRCGASRRVSGFGATGARGAGPRPPGPGPGPLVPGPRSPGPCNRVMRAGACGPEPRARALGPDPGARRPKPGAAGAPGPSSEQRRERT